MHNACEALELSVILGVAQLLTVTADCSAPLLSATANHATAHGPTALLAALPVPATTDQPRPSNTSYCQQHDHHNDWPAMINGAPRCFCVLPLLRYRTATPALP